MPQAHLDVAALYSTLDSERREREISWRGLAGEAGVAASTLTRMAQGKRPDVDSFAKLINWLGVPAEQFIRASNAKAKSKADRRPSTVAVISAHLRASRDLTPDSAAALSAIVAAAYKRLKSTK